MCTNTDLQCVKKVLFDNRGLVGFPVGPVVSFHQIFDGHVGLLGKIFEKIHLTMYCRRIIFLWGREGEGGEMLLRMNVFGDRTS